MKQLKYCLFTISMLIASLCVNAQNVVQAEYFLDTDPGFGLATPYTGFAQDTNISVTIPIAGSFFTGATPGHHQLYCRTKDANNNWSITTRRTIDILAADVPLVAAAGEWFIDADPGHGNGTAFSVSPQDTNITQQFTMPASSFTVLQPGYHQLYGRVKNNLGTWGQTYRRTIEVVEDPTTPQITAAEYFFNTDPTFGNATRVELTPSSDSTWTFNIPASSLQTLAGNTGYLYLRTTDTTKANWAITVRKDISFTYCSGAPATPGNIAGPSTICAGAQANYYISAVTGASAYTWTLTGSITGNASATDSLTAIAGMSQGTATITVTANNPCGSSAAQAYTVSIDTVDIQVHQNGGVLAADAQNATYQWIDCDNNHQPVSGEVNQTFTAVSNGNYAVIVTQNGCSDTSACIYVNDLAVGNTHAGSLSIYPNPATGIINILLPAIPDAGTYLTISNMLGQKIKGYALSWQKTTLNTELPAGTYIITITDKTQTTTQKLVIE